MSGAAHAYWLAEPTVGEIRPVVLPRAGPEDVVVRTVCSAISRGTETLVFGGRVPESQYAAMRAPFQDGDFPGPVKYGYLSVGLVEEGPAHLLGRLVFCLFPHQTRYVVPADAVVPVPDGIPPERAVLAGTVETAVNALWDAAPLVGDRVAVVGAGMVGCCVARLLAQMPGVRTTLVDVDASRATVAAALGVDFALASEVVPGAGANDLGAHELGANELGAHELGAHELGAHDLVLHTSATSEGLQLSVDLLGEEGEVVELSWYGDRTVSLALGGSFHSRRLGIRASQVGAVSPARRARRTPADRLALALDLLQDPAFDALVTGRSSFGELPAVMARLCDGSLPAIVHLITYDQG